MSAAAATTASAPTERPSVLENYRDDGPLAGVNDQVFDFLRQIGLK